MSHRKSRLKPPFPPGRLHQNMWSGKRRMVGEGADCPELGAAVQPSRATVKLPYGEATSLQEEGFESATSGHRQKSSQSYASPVSGGTPPTRETRRDDDDDGSTHAPLGVRTPPESSGGLPPTASGGPERRCSASRAIKEVNARKEESVLKQDAAEEATERTFRYI